MILDIVIPDKNSFFTLFAHGEHLRKVYLKDKGVTTLSYLENSVVYLFYTYPTHRVACVIRNNSGQSSLPGLSKNVSLLFSVHASKVDKLHRAFSFLNRRGVAFTLPDDFYLRLFFILSQRGKINYGALRELLDNSSKHQ